jgi:hypothetical protein
MLPQAANAELGNFFEALFRRKIFEIWLRLRRLPAVVRPILERPPNLRATQFYSGSLIAIVLRFSPSRPTMLSIARFSFSAAPVTAKSIVGA